MRKKIEFEKLKDETIVAVRGLEIGSAHVHFETASGKEFAMYHSQDCCESVSVEDVCGDASDLIGSPILLAEEVVSNENPEGLKPEYQDSFTWTFYRLSTIKGGVTIRWYGESNGYYSESVDFAQVKP